MINPCLLKTRNCAAALLLLLLLPLLLPPLLLPHGPQLLAKTAYKLC
jgi:hypothetical protein